MTTTPVAVLLGLNLVLLLAALIHFDKSYRNRDSLLLAVLFFFSGMPALIYQVVWQRALFAVYGVNAESVAVIVAAFMLGLGLGNLLGGWLATRYPQHAAVIFGVAEIGIAVFGLASLAIFGFAAERTAGTTLPYVVLFSFALLSLPTCLMGATLPLLVSHLVKRSGRVGVSVALLYFVNTFGSAVACYFCATFLLGQFQMSGAVLFAALINLAVGATAYLYGRTAKVAAVSSSPLPAPHEDGGHSRFKAALWIGAISGFVALGFEIVWFRIFVLASSDRAPAFALLLATYLGGLAAGSYFAERLTSLNDAATRRMIGYLLIAGGVLASYVPPVLAAFTARGIPFLHSAPIFFLNAAMLGAVFPLVCRLGVSADERAGRNVSYIYLANILGSVLGSLGIGFGLMHYLGLRDTSLALAGVAVVCGGIVFFLAESRSRVLVPLMAVGLLAVWGAKPLYSGVFEKLIFATAPESRIPFTRVVENRAGVIGLTRDQAVFGGGVYDGYFNTDPTNDVNLVVRAYAVSAFHPAPRRMLLIGLASGSWAQALAHHPQVEVVDIVEINPGYIKLIEENPVVRSLLRNPKVRIIFDDGRRWMLAHPEEKYDLIVANTTFHWRDHSSSLLSVEFLERIRKHLTPGGIYYCNTTGSDGVIATGMSVFPHALRVINFMALSDAPIQVNKNRWRAILEQYTIDGKLIFDPSNPRAAMTIGQYMALADSLGPGPRLFSLETGDSLKARIGRRLLITDNNMGAEWTSYNVLVPWQQPRSPNPAPAAKP